MILWPETLAVVQKIIFHGSGIVFIPVQKETIWVSHRVLIIPIRNIEVFPEGEESLWDKIQEITSGIGIVKIFDVLHDFGGEVMGRGRKVDI